MRKKLDTHFPVIWVYGDRFKSMLVAVVPLHEENTRKWADLNGYTGSFSELCSLDHLRRFVLPGLKSVAERNKLRGFEHIKGVMLESRPFDMERDLVIETLKKKRNKLHKYYLDQYVAEHSKASDESPLIMNPFEMIT